MLRATAADEGTLRERIEDHFASGALRILLFTALERILRTEDRELRQTALEGELNYALADRDPFADALAGAFLPGVGRPIGRRPGITDGGSRAGRPGKTRKPKDPKERASRLPRSKGRWMGEPGESLWYSTHPEVIEVTRGKPIRSEDGWPDLSPWAVPDPFLFKIGQLDGSKKDFRLVYERLAERLGLKNKTAARNYLRKRKLTPHHHDKRTILLVPTALNCNLPHVGSASDLRRKRGNRKR